MPYRNLKFLVIFNKALGIFPGKVVNGRLRPNSAWDCCFYIIWFLFHCLCLGIFYYRMYMASPAEKAKKEYSLSILRTTVFFASIFPYNFLAAFWSEDFIKFSNRLVIYDEQAVALGHRRKDKHIFLYLFFVYTFTTLNLKTYYNYSEYISQGIIGILNLLYEMTPSVVGTYSVLVTCIFLDLIRQRFRHLNETIVPHVSELPVTGSQDEITLYDVRYLHGLLLDSAKKINALFGISTLTVFLSILLELVASVYNLIEDLQANKDGEYVEMLDLMFQTIYLFAMYHITAHEINRVEERVIKYGLSFSNKKCRIDKIEMMLYFYHKRYTFTAAEFFSLDMTIFVPIAIAVTTYLTLIA